MSPSSFRRLFCACALAFAGSICPPASAQTLPAPKDDEAVKLAPFEVISDKGTRGYGTTNAVGATRVNAPIEITPQSVISLNQ